jgi:hypothetical protein
MITVRGRVRGQALTLSKWKFVSETNQRRLLSYMLVKFLL